MTGVYLKLNIDMPTLLSQFAKFRNYVILGIAQTPRLRSVQFVINTIQ